MIPIKEIESLAKERTRNVASVTHDFDHLKRTAKGASWFVKVFGGSQEEQEMAYAGGLLHDIVRPASEKVCHAEASAKESEKILSKMGMGEDEKAAIIKAIKDHRLPVKWESPLHQSIYLADKILEQMGAFVAFRRCYYVGECEDYRHTDMADAFQKHFGYRMKRIKKTDFPESVEELVGYQWGWLQDFSENIGKKDRWALELGKGMYESAMQRKRLEDAIRNYEPEHENGNRYKREAVDYINGRKFREFGRLVNL